MNGHSASCTHLSSEVPAAVLQVLKQRLAINLPSLNTEGGFFYEEGDDLEEDEAEASRSLLPRTLAGMYVCIYVCLQTMLMLVLLQKGLLVMLAGLVHVSPGRQVIIERLWAAVGNVSSNLKLVWNFTGRPHGICTWLPTQCLLASRQRLHSLKDFHWPAGPQCLRLHLSAAGGTQSMLAMHTTAKNDIV